VHRYDNNEVMVVGATEEENVLNCRVGSVPIKYLRILVSNIELYATDLLYLGLKVEKRLPI
jgi:hypothetical protein